jgi:hypothetical protein
MAKVYGAYKHVHVSIFCFLVQLSTKKGTVRFFKLESVTLSREKNSKISHNISISPAIVRSDKGKLFSLIETRSNLEKICKTDFKSFREIPIYSLLNIFAQFTMEAISSENV